MFILYVTLDVTVYAALCNSGVVLSHRVRAVLSHRRAHYPVHATRVVLREATRKSRLTCDDVYFRCDRIRHVYYMLQVIL